MMLLPSCFLNARNSMLDCVRRVALPRNVAKIRAVKAGDVFVRIAQTQLGNDVMPDLPRGAGRERRDRRDSENSAADC